MKKSGKDRLKSTIYESTLPTADAIPLPQWGRLRYENAAIPETQPRRQRGGGFAAKKEANPASLRSAAPSKGRGSRGYACTCQQKLDTKLKKLGIKIEYLYQIQ